MLHPKDPRRPDFREFVKEFRAKGPSSPKMEQKVSMTAYGANPKVKSGLEAYNGDWNEDQAARFLRRLLFGARKTEVEHFKSITFTQAVDEMLSPPSQTATPPVNDYEGQDGASDPFVQLGETWIDAPFSNTVALPRVITLKAWMLGNITNQNISIFEKMALFWHNLLVTEIWNVFIPKLSYSYLELIRNNSLGNFKKMIKELTVDPAMLIYLNGTFNTKEAADENYGRELQELFCVGKGPGSGYTEGDVQAAARVLTGWQVNWQEVQEAKRVGSSFEPDRHDPTDKQFSSFYGNKVIQGRSGTDGEQELDDLLDMIFETNETALYICRRIYQFFVNGEIDELAEENVIKPLAEIFRSNNYEVKPVLEALIRSAHFNENLQVGAQIKSPVEFLLGIWRTMGMEYHNTDDIREVRRVNAALHWELIKLGMEVGDPPGVAGWPAYYQAPLYDKSWIAVTTIVARARLSDKLVYDGLLLDNDSTIPVDFVRFVDTMEHPEDPNALINEATNLLLGHVISDQLKTDLKSILLSGQGTDSYWTDAWLTYKGDPNDENRSVIENRLNPAFQSIFQLAEFHLT